MRSAHLWLLLASLALAVPALAADPCAPPLVEQQCYEIKPAAFDLIPVGVADQFGLVHYSIRYPHRFCTETGSEAPAGALVGYTIRQPAQAPLTRQVTTRFGELTLDLIRPFLLFAPTRVGVGAQSPVAPPDDQQHLQCWQVKPSSGAPRFRVVRDVEVIDQLERSRVDLLEPVYLCGPASVDGADPDAAVRMDQLLCYRTQSSPSFGTLDVTLENRFESDDATLIHRRELCVPTIDTTSSSSLPPVCPPTTTTSTTTSTTTTTTTTSTTTTSTTTTSTTTTTTSTTTTSTTTTTTTSTTTTTAPPVCGNGRQEAGEACDDGNRLPGDCCSVTCAVDPDGTPCSDGDVCNGAEACRAGRCEAPDSCRTSFLIAAVSNFGSNTVSLIDGASAAVTATVPVGSGPWGVALHPLGTEIWVTNRKGNSVSVIDVASRAVTDEIAVSRVPLGIVFDPTGARAYVASYGRDVVDVLDTASRSRVARYRVDRGPAGLALDASGSTLYITGFGANTLLAIDPATGAVRSRVRVGRKPLQLAIDEAGGRVYVANFASRSISVVGMVSRSVLATVQVDGKPFGVTVDPTRGRAFVTDSAGEGITVVDTAASRVIASVPVPSGPLGIGVDPSGRVLVTSGRAGVISVLDPDTGGVGSATVGVLPVAFGQFVGTVSSDCAGSAPRCNGVDPTLAGTCAPRAGCQFVARPTSDALAALLDTMAATVDALPPDGVRDQETVQQLARAIAQARQQLDDGGAASLKPTIQGLIGTIRTALRRKAFDRAAALRLLDLARGARILVRRA